MQIKRISIYNEFRCTGADCPISCCRGWKIPIDDEMYLKYLREKGLFGLVLRTFIEKKAGIVAFRSRYHKGCPFWGADRLCRIQKKHGTEYMPLVCIRFPRQLYHLNFFCEETLYLACPEAAGLFLKSVAEDRPFDFETVTGDVSYGPNTTNDDKEFLDYLLKSRAELIEILGRGISYDSMAIQNYGRDARNACLNQTPLPVPLNYLSDTRERSVFNCEIMNTLFWGGFYHPSLRTLSPFLYRLCKKYIRTLGIPYRKNPRAADQKLAALKDDFYRKLPHSGRLLNRYFEYYLQTDFLNIFEDYSFSKHLIFGVAKTNMLWVFTALYAENKKRITDDELARIIAVYERRAPQIEDALKKITVP